MTSTTHDDETGATAVTDAPVPSLEEEEYQGVPARLQRITDWAASSLVPPEIWTQDRPSLRKQFTYARAGQWGPCSGLHRYAALVAFWLVSFPTSVAAYYLEWVGERPARWTLALVLCSLTYQLPYAPEIVSLLIRIPAWPITATWSLLASFS